MYRKVSLSSFHNGKVEKCTTSCSGDIEENASAVFFTQTLLSIVREMRDRLSVHHRLV